MRTRIEERWDALEPDPDRPVFQLLDAGHPHNFYIGRQITGERLFLLIEAEKPPDLKSMRSLHISSFQRHDGRWGLLLSLAAPELAAVFALLCNDLAESSRHLPVGVAASICIARRLGTWRLLLEQPRADTLPPSQVRGLFAELWVLRNSLLAGTGAHDAIESWVGPLGADQDFQMAELAWEVKSVQPDASSFSIASEMQLYSSTRKVYVLLVQLAEVSERARGISLNELVSDLRGRLVQAPDARSVFDDRLDAAKYLVRHEYENPTFEVTGTGAFEVTDAFPRLIRPNVPAGVMNVRYEVSLDACAHHSVPWPIGTDKKWN